MNMPRRTVICDCGYALDLFAYTNTCMCGCDLPFVIETETEVTVIAIAHPIESITKDRKEQS